MEPLTARVTHLPPSFRREQAVRLVDTHGLKEQGLLRQAALMASAPELGLQAIAHSPSLFGPLVPRGALPEHAEPLAGGVRGEGPERVCGPSAGSALLLLPESTAGPSQGLSRELNGLESAEDLSHVHEFLDMGWDLGLILPLMYPVTLGNSHALGFSPSLCETGRRAQPAWLSG